MLKVTCDGCGATYQAPESFAGRKIRCKKCAGVLSIPAADTGGAVSELDETAVMDAAERREMARTRPDSGSKGKRSFKAPAKGPGGLAKPGSGKKKVGIGAAQSTRRQPPGGDGSRRFGGGDTGKKGASKGVLIVGVVGVLAVVLVGLYAFTDLFSGGDDAGTSQQTVARGESGDDVDGDDVDGDDVDGDDVDGDDVDGDDVGPAGRGAAGDDDDDLVGDVQLVGDDSDTTGVDDRDDAGGDRDAAPGTAAGLATVLPADTGAVVSIDVQRLRALVDKLDMLPPGALQDTASVLKVLPGVEDGGADALRFLELMGLDPVNDIRRVTLGAEIPDLTDPQALTAPPSGGVIVLEGKFDREKIVRGLAFAQLIDGERPVDKGGLEAYAATIDGEPAFFSFVSPGQVVVADEASFAKVVALRNGEGKSITSNEALASLAGGFARTDALWIGAEIPPAALALAAAEGGESPWKFSAVSLAIDTMDTGIRFALLGGTASEAVAKQQLQMIGLTILPLLSGMAMQTPFAKELQPLIKKLIPKVVESRVEVAFVLTPEDLQTIQTVVAGMMAGFAGPGLETAEATLDGFDAEDGAGDGAGVEDEESTLPDLGSDDDLDDI